MSTKYTIIGSIFAFMSTPLFIYKFDHLGILFTILAIGFFIYAFFVHKEPKQKETNGGATSKAYGLDDETTLVVKSIGASENEFIDFNAIVNDTNLSLKEINIALDWLFLSKLISENKGRRGKVYKLEPEGKILLNSMIIAEEHNKKINSDHK